MTVHIKKLLKSITFAVGVGILVLLYMFFFKFVPPGNFPEGSSVLVTNGKGLSEIAYELRDQHIIRSPFWLVNFIILLKHERQIVGGEYYFEKPMNVYQVAKRITSGDFQIEQLKTTIPEGSTVFDISDILRKNYPNFNSSRFVLLALPKEGYLFPDTYKFGATITPEKVIQVMNDNFKKKTEQADVQVGITEFGKPLKDIITMASILEGEARQTRTRRIVAGILWTRLRLGIPLQVDAAFRYVNGKTTEELTLDDLKTDSPYNTYLYKGLTPGPISNPGIDSIMAAVTPIWTDYLYFLTDKDGEMRYAETLEQHEANIAKYLR
jgi:UPF0755 protein